MIKIMVENTVLKIGLDRFVLGLPYPKPPKYVKEITLKDVDIEKIKVAQKDYVACMKHIENTIKETGPFILQKSKNKDLKRYKVFSDKDNSLLCIFSLGFCFGTGLINLELNPSKMTPNNWSELLALLSMLFNNHYEEFYSRAVVSHAEFYVDVAGEVLSNLVLIDEGKRANTIFKGTTYKGKRNSPLVATMYDKGKEQHVNEKLVRVEVRLNRNDILFKDLVEKDLFNPFSKFLVVNVNQVQLIAKSFGCPSLSKIIIEYGLYVGVKNKYALKHILQLLKDNVIFWWKPALFWTIHREMLLKLQPNSTGGIDFEYADQC